LESGFLSGNTEHLFAFLMQYRTVVIANAPKGSRMLRKMMIGGAAMALAALTATPASATTSAASAAPSDRIAVDVVTVNGSGCPRGTAAVTERPDNSAFTITYSDYIAQAGAGSAPTDFRKNCQLSLLVHVPQGFTYAIARAEYRGFAFLEAGTTGEERANYYFQGQSQTVPVSHPINGPFDDDWQNTDTADAASLVYAPCGEDRILNINTELRVRSGNSDSVSFMTMDSTRGTINTIYHFAWKQCS
jgi:hypothetical protein